MQNILYFSKIFTELFKTQWWKQAPAVVRRVWELGSVHKGCGPGMSLALISCNPSPGWTLIKTHRNLTAHHVYLPRNDFCYCFQLKVFLAPWHLFKIYKRYYITANFYLALALYGVTGWSVYQMTKISNGTNQEESSVSFTKTDTLCMTIHGF